MFALTGAGASPVAFTRSVNGWFTKNRGLALGIALMSTGVVAAALPAALVPHVAENGWRAGFVFLSVLVIVPLPLVWLWTKDTGPEDQSMPTTAATERTWDFVIAQNAQRTVYKLAALFFVIALAVCGLIPNFVPMLLDGGIPPSEVGKFAGAIGISVIVGRLVTGVLVDRIFAPYVTAVSDLRIASQQSNRTQANLSTTMACGR